MTDKHSSNKNRLQSLLLSVCTRTKVMLGAQLSKFDIVPHAHIIQFLASKMKHIDVSNIFPILAQENWKT